MINIIDLQERENNKLREAEEFHALVIEKLSMMLNAEKEGYIVTKQEKVCNNISKIGYNIRYKNENISPVIYLPDDIALFMTKSNVENATRYIMHTYKKECNPKIDIYPLKNKDYILSNVVYSVVSKKGNEEYLKGKVTKDYLDLAVIYRVKINKYASCLVTKSLLYNMDITKTELDNAAKVNTPRWMQFTVKPIHTEMLDTIIEDRDIMNRDWDMSNISYLPQYFEKYPEEKQMLFVCGSAHLKEYAGSIILYTEYFEALANAMDSDLYIIPSSIHECMAFNSDSDIYGEKIEEIKELISIINTEEVADEEVLSNSLYKYSRDTKEITIV